MTRAGRPDAAGVALKTPAAEGRIRTCGGLGQAGGGYRPFSGFSGGSTPSGSGTSATFRVIDTVS